MTIFCRYSGLRIEDSSMSTARSTRNKTIISLSGTVWVLSICVGIEGIDEAIFHFRGYIQGRWVAKVLVKRREAVMLGEWELGSNYLLHLELLELDQHGDLKGQLLEMEQMDLGKTIYWDDF